MSISALRELISDVVEEKLAKYTDPDHGLELREDFVERLITQKEKFDAGEETGISAEQVYSELGLK